MPDPVREESVLVVGGGIAGITAALNAADYGHHVYLIDDTASIGGLMARLDKTFPTNDCSICIEAPKMYEVNTHPNIEILTNTEVRKVKPRDDGFNIRLIQRAKYVDEKIGGTRKLISIPYPQAVPSSNYVDIRCRSGEAREDGACVGGCVVDCSQCRECPIAYCVKACKEEGKDAVKLWQQDGRRDIEVKSVIIATGVKSHEPPDGLYGYNQYDNVITYLHFERLMNAGGSTEGEIIRPSGKEHAHKVAWIQCVDRGDRGLPYCSKVCCMVAAKQTIIAKEEDPETKNLSLRYEDVVNGTIEDMEVDMLVLSSGLEANERNRRLAKAFKLELGENGFFKQRDPLGAPLETDVPGVYLAGGATGPIDISESVVQSTAAGMKAVQKRRVAVEAAS